MDINVDGVNVSVELITLVLESVFLFVLVFVSFVLLAPQSGALRISAYGDFQSHPNPSTYSFRAFKPFYSDQKQCK